MDRLSSYAVDPVSAQLALLNVLLAVYLCCKGIGWATSVFLRRDPPVKKLNRREVARRDDS
jgi:hypothetical protein